VVRSSAASDVYKRQRERLKEKMSKYFRLV
jgi:hypothetical protein